MKYSFLFLCCFLLIGCGGLHTNFNTATGKQETSLYTSDREQDIGAGVALEIEKEFLLVDDVEMNQRVDGLLQRIVQVSDRKELVYIVKVIEEKEEDKKKADDKPIVNALALPGGYIYLFKGLVDYVKDDDDALASVIAHEVGHITARHSIKRLQASYGSLAAVVGSIFVDGRLAGGINAATTAMFFEYSKEDEMQADSLAVKYMRLAGFDPQGTVRMLNLLLEYERKQPIRPKSFGRTHPFLYERIAATNKEITGDLTYRDYIRATGERQGVKK